MSAQSLGAEQIREAMAQLSDGATQTSDSICEFHKATEQLARGDRQAPRRHFQVPNLRNSEKGVVAMSARGIPRARCSSVCIVTHSSVCYAGPDVLHRSDTFCHRRAPREPGGSQGSAAGSAASEPYVAGLLDFRGTVLAVVDLATRLFGTACTSSLSTRIIIVQIQHSDREVPLGLIAEQVTELCQADVPAQLSCRRPRLGTRLFRTHRASRCEVGPVDRSRSRLAGSRCVAKSLTNCWNEAHGLDRFREPAGAGNRARIEFTWNDRVPPGRRPPHADPRSRKLCPTTSSSSMLIPSSCRPSSRSWSFEKAGSSGMRMHLNFFAEHAASTMRERREPYRVLSFPCAGGEEPYSIVMSSARSRARISPISSRCRGHQRSGFAEGPRRQIRIA